MRDNDNKRNIRKQSTVSSIRDSFTPLCSLFSNLSNDEIRSLIDHEENEKIQCQQQ